MASTRTALFARSTPGGIFTVENVAEHPGAVFFVDSTAAGAGDTVGHGANPDQPFATLDYAIGQCTADKGDVIYVMPGHVETITAANGIDADIAGISIIGLGNGTNKPTITIGTATTASFRVNAANVKVAGLRFLAGTAQLLVKMIDVNKNYCTIEDCDLVGASPTATFLVQSFINLATTFDNLTVRRCTFQQGTDPVAVNGAADTGAIYLVDSENVLIEDCRFIGNIETAFVHNKTTGAVNLWVRNCYGVAALSDCVPFIIPSGATGGIFGGGYVTPAATDTTESALVGTLPNGFFALGVYFGNDGVTGGGQGGILPTAAT